MRDAITQREEFRNWEHLKVVEWQTKNIVAMVANTVEDAKARQKLSEYSQGLSLTGGTGTASSGSSRSRKQKTYRTIDGKEITSKELSNYSYEEIDHSGKEQTSIAQARNKNAGKNLSGFGGFTR